MLGKKTVCDKLRENYEKAQVVTYVTILGETVSVSREEALGLFGCRVEKDSVTDKAMKTLSELRKDADMEVFQKIFGKVLGEHLWRKWNSVEDGDLIKLWDVLSSEPRKMLLAYLNKAIWKQPKAKPLPFSIED